ncbi:ATP-binding protein [Streptomyces monticola]|uniref:ATP-binding protein n=1 Tax=Streptomyces monticola TaxID=2666263 RepID=A0ABW2JMN1_9ACTN
MTVTPFHRRNYLVYRWTSCTPNPAAEARTALRRALVRQGLPGDLINDAVLTVSELVANAAEHACGPYEVRVRCGEKGIVCHVRDGDPAIPHVPAYPAAAPFEPDPADRGGGLDALCVLLTEHGRGLRIVDHLTRGIWGFRSAGGIKTAWAAFARAPYER